MTDEHKIIVFNLWLSGFSLKQIAGARGVAYGTARKWAIRGGQISFIRARQSKAAQLEQAKR